MWKLQRIIAENLCAFRSLDYYPAQGVTTLIFGSNRDSESQGSNGSGKSALLEAVAVGMTGSPMRKVKNEEIIRDDADECWICLVFENEVTAELFTVERQILRKSPSVVTCHVRQNSRQKEAVEVVQPSVDAYNKYILERIGITREELFSNFLLSKNRYTDFLSASDKQKKEIINRFSNASLVDRAIEELRRDCQPVETQVREAELELAGIEGRVRMLSEQIEHEEKNTSERADRRKLQIAALEQRISEKRTFIRECKEQITIEKTAVEKLGIVDTTLQHLENSDKGPEECYGHIKTEVLPLLSGTPTDWNGVLSDKKQKLSRLETELGKWNIQLEDAAKATAIRQAEYDSLNSDYKQIRVENHGQQRECEQRLTQLDAELEKMNGSLEEQRKKRQLLYTGIESLRNKLAGTIACPACGHEFITAERDFDVNGGKRQLDGKQKQADELSGEIRRAEGMIAKAEESQKEIHKDKRSFVIALQEWSDRLDTVENDLQTARREQETVNLSRRQITDGITLLQSETGSLRRKLFDEVFGLLDDTFRLHEKKLDEQKEDIQMAESSIITLQDAIKEYNSVSAQDVTAGLRGSLKEYNKKAGEVLQEKSRVEEKLRVLHEQEQYFIQFQTFLANTKIAALSKVTNEFLENIDSDIRIRFDGYTVLKSGKVREKISVSLLRDGVDCGSYGKFSEGERARVNLASVVAMQKLVNGNCETGKGLDFMFIDEIADAMDADGLASVFSALNKQNVTALVVSHGSVAEGYRYKLLITKHNGESTLD